MDRQRMRSELARVRGLGSAREGVESWWLERVTVVALVPVTLWFAARFISLSHGGYTTFVAWLKGPLAALFMGLLLIALFVHLALGLWQVIEDYVHSGARISALIAARYACFSLGIAGILATLRILFRT